MEMGINTVGNSNALNLNKINLCVPLSTSLNTSCSLPTNLIKYKEEMQYTEKNLASGLKLSEEKESLNILFIY